MHTLKSCTLGQTYADGNSGLHEAQKDTLCPEYAACICPAVQEHRAVLTPRQSLVSAEVVAVYLVSFQLWCHEETTTCISRPLAPSSKLPLHIEWLAAQTICQRKE